MRMLHRWATAAILAAFGIGAPEVLAQSQPAPSQQKESLGEAARKARAKKKAPTKPGKVLTNDDLESGPRFAGAVQTAPAPGEQAGPAQEAQPGEQAAATEDQGEKYWRKRFAEAHDKLAKAEKELSILEREWEKGQVQYYPDPQKALKEQHTRAGLNENAAKIEAKRKEIAQLKQAVSDLEDELRRAGGDPGWAR